jgi:hypothetical protein
MNYSHLSKYHTSCYWFSVNVKLISSYLVVIIIKYFYADSISGHMAAKSAHEEVKSFMFSLHFSVRYIVENFVPDFQILFKTVCLIFHTRVSFLY